MKLAVVGQGPLAIHAALHFKQLGAEVTLFKKEALGGNLHLLKTHFPQFKFQKTWKDLTSEIGRELVELSADLLHEKPTAEEYWENYLVPLVERSDLFSHAKTAEVVRIHKRFLSQKEVIEGRSRLLDLFRVVFTLDPKESILKQVAENPETFEQLGQEVLNSLHETVEGFHDFDLVIDARGKFYSTNPMGASNTYALNEKRLNDEKIVFYGADFLKKSPDFSHAKNIVLVGSGETIALSLLKLKDWFIKNLNVRLYIFTDEKLPFSSITNPWLQNELKTFFDETSAGYENDKLEFERRIRAWRDLEDYEKVKVAKPTEPVNRMQLFNGYSVVAMDKLLDRDGVFVTAETVDFRQDFQNLSEADTLKTVPADFIIVGKGYRLQSRDEVSEGLMLNEPGYFDLRGLSLNTGIQQIHEIEKVVMAFFQRQ